MSPTGQGQRSVLETVSVLNISAHYYKILQSKFSTVYIFVLVVFHKMDVKTYLCFFSRNCIVTYKSTTCRANISASAMDSRALLLLGVL